MLTTTKRQFVAYWLDDGAPRRRYCAIDRDRVAYLLRAARSRGDTIHTTRQCCGWNYQIGELAINERR